MVVDVCYLGSSVRTVNCQIFFKLRLETRSLDQIHSFPVCMTPFPSWLAFIWADSIGWYLIHSNFRMRTGFKMKLRTIVGFTWMLPNHWARWDWKVLLVWIMLGAQSHHDMLVLTIHLPLKSKNFISTYRTMKICCP